MGWSVEKPVRPTPSQVMEFLSESFEDDGTSRLSIALSTTVLMN